MNTSYKWSIQIAMLTLVAAAAVEVRAFEFVPLGGLSGPTFSSRPKDISGDGIIVVGSSRGEAFRWTRETGMVGLGDLPGGDFGSGANAISLDGSTIVGFGTTDIDAGTEAVRWTAADGIVSLNSLVPNNDPRVNTFYEANGVSDDGSVIVGSGDSLSFREFPAVRWTEATGPTALPIPFEGFIDMFAHDISGDGSIIVGEVFDSIPDALIWPGDGTVDFLVDFTGEPTEAIAISRDGSVVVGETWFSASGIGPAFRWTEQDGAVSLGVPPGLDDFDGSVAWGISADGSTIVGGGVEDGEPGERFAAIWTEQAGWQVVEDILTAQGIDLTGWELTRAIAASANGHVIVGEGINPQGRREGWLAIIAVPEPSTLAMIVCLLCGYWLSRRR